MPDNQDKYGGETGLIDNFTMTIEKSEFTNDVRYNNGATLLLKWTGTVVTEDGEVLEDRSEQFSCGNGWTTPDGVTAVHDNGKTKFNNSSIVQRMIDRCVKDLGIADALDKGDDNGLGSRNANIWTGLRFRLKQETMKFGKDMEDKVRVMPCEFLGAGDGAPATAAPSAGATSAQPPSAAVPTPQSAAPTTPAPSAAPSANGGAGNEVLLAQLRGLAAQAADHQAFKDAAMAQFPAILEPANESVLTQVIAADGIYASAHA